MKDTFRIFVKLRKVKSPTANKDINTGLIAPRYVRRKYHTEKSKMGQAIDRIKLYHS